ncbi:sclerostin domain-containing protein 1a isoform X1 [Puntigrus tetrazona]|uniref:sclerostin domain-containing protein 1a isoform X1 n=1 Tax=Puntigrus tetrazona TaxID=1606681 RepID=UPI001C8A66DB|nr:sclerostin domain-containing protein 1a isoform X1 [Puntigrus tetrazona]
MIASENHSDSRSISPQAVGCLTSNMYINAPESCNFMFLFCFLIKSGLTLKNDATEIFYSHVVGPVQDAQSNASLNRARSGGRAFAAHERERIPVGCRELRSTKYISDGQCTSINPVKELVCTGQCLPAQMLPNWIGGYGRKFWNRRNSQDWRCVNDKTRTQRIQLQCQDGSARTYKITVVTSCKCKRYTRQHNESGVKSEGYAHSQIKKQKNKGGTRTES